MENEFSQRLKQEYLLPAAMSDENFQQTAQQCQQIATLTLFQGDNVPFSETELASFVTASGASSMTDLVATLSIYLSRLATRRFNH
ncbi:hypothetical protein PN36_32745 [Candidatus Thiomargarita nelsonii]|uniref:Uncharacterized protein n=1 Tax=Candidatus Thiomargarita nelsonii TaxID=1003181 RepID=A0A4E0QKP1_9GAMM|nr:hypothetical protein PN36_32745 [Candidatus Thiomargarita nelsonii]